MVAFIFPNQSAFRVINLNRGGSNDWIIISGRDSGVSGRKKERGAARHLIHGGDDPKVFEAKIQVFVIFTWVLSFVAYEKDLKTSIYCRLGTQSK